VLPQISGFAGLPGRRRLATQENMTNKACLLVVKAGCFFRRPNMARITVEDCLEQVGDDNRFALVHLAVQRIRQHRKGEPFLVEGKNKEIVMTLREIASGDVTFDNIMGLPAERRAREAAEREEIAEVEDAVETEQV
jgi:DNA-directed RNA polymerase subunit omega